MIKVACAIIKNDENRLLMVQRSRHMVHPMQWEFPGGKLLQHETASEAIQREMLEELDLTVRPLSEYPEVFWEYPDKKIVLVPVKCEIRSGEMHLREHVKSRWLTIGEMKGMNVLEADRLIIQQLESDS